MSEQLIWGECRNCGTPVYRPTFRCEGCGTNTVELFATPVSAGCDVESSAGHATRRLSPTLPRRASTRDRLWSFVIWLAIAIGAAITGFILAGAAGISEFVICGDSSDCGSHSFLVLLPERIFTVLAAVAALIALASLLLALAQVFLALKWSWRRYVTR
jgi:hypothetical protein